MGAQKTFELLSIFTGCIIVASAAGRLVNTSWNEGAIIMLLAYLVIFIASTLSGLASLEMSLLNPADSWEYKPLLKSYMTRNGLFYLISYISYTLWKKEIKTNPKEQQIKVLLSILEEKKDTIYGNDYNLNEIKSREDFIKKHPITEYIHYKDYCERVANGEQNVMNNYEVIYIALSSGTTGKSKMIPVSEQGSKRLFAFKKANTEIFYYMLKYSRMIALRRCLNFAMYSPPKTAPSGIPMGALSNAKMYSSREVDTNIVPGYCQYIYNESASFYVMAIFSLREEELGAIQGFSSDLMFCWFQFIMKHKEEILCDIKNGYISPFPYLEEKIRWKLNSKLSAKPDRADKLKCVFDGPRESLAMRIWPSLWYVGCARSGSYAHSANLLEKTFLRDVNFKFTVHGCTECIFGWNFDVYKKEIFTLAIRAAFMEFIPVENMDDENPKTLFVENLRLGMHYEIVVTNFEGLYRYRTGDIIEIVGYDGEIPTYKFKHRRQHILNIARTPDTVIFQALVDVEKQWNGPKVKNYTCCESYHIQDCIGREYEKKCYVIFIELETDGVTTQKLTSIHENTLDNALTDLQDEYRLCKINGSIGPIEIIQVKNGTFDDLRMMLFGGRPHAQFKMPRVLRKPEILQFLFENIAYQLEENDDKGSPQLENLNEMKTPEFEGNEEKKGNPLDDYDEKIKHQFEVDYEKITPQFEDNDDKRTHHLKDNDEESTHQSEDFDENNTSVLVSIHETIKLQLEYIDKKITSQLDKNDEKSTHILEADNEKTTHQLEDDDEKRTPQLEDDDEKRTPQLEDDDEKRTPKLEDNDQNKMPQLEVNYENRTPQLEENDENRSPELEDNDKKRTPQLENDNVKITPQLEDIDENIIYQSGNDNEEIKSESKDNDENIIHIFEDNDEKRTF